MANDQTSDIKKSQYTFHKEQMDSHEVEKIIEVGLDAQGCLGVLVKWHGYSESQNSWEPVENLHTCDDVMAQIGFLGQQSKPHSDLGISSNSQLERRTVPDDIPSTGSKLSSDSSQHSTNMDILSGNGNLPALVAKQITLQNLKTKTLESITECDIRSYFLQNGGMVRNEEIVNYFRKPLCEPATRDAARKIFASILNKLSTRKIQEGVVWYTLKDEYTERIGLDTTSQFQIQLEFLVYKFLAEGSYGEAAEVFKKEMERRKSIPKSLSPITGETVAQSFNAWVSGQLSHIGSGYLAEILKKLLITHPEFTERRKDLGLPPSLLSSGTVHFLKSLETGSKEKKKTYSITANNIGAVSPTWLMCREYSGSTSFPSGVFRRLALAGRVIGHWDRDKPCQVKCVLFDQTGKFIFTGAHDKIVKIWSVKDGRLLRTLRGSVGGISALAINEDNTLVAASSSRFICIWSLSTAQLLEVISLASPSSKVLTIVFCPLPRQTGFRYLCSTHLDGSTAFWIFEEFGNQIKFRPIPQLVDKQDGPGSNQISCCSFSPGGVFVVTGSADKTIRIFHMLAVGGPKLVFQKECHLGRVESVAWANRGLRFLSGSRDGSAIVWGFEKNNWTFKRINCQQSSQTISIGTDAQRLTRAVWVIKVCWNCDDSLIFTSTSKNLVMVWEPESGRLVRILQAHSEEIVVLETHPIHPKILCSAAFDGKIVLWDIGFQYGLDTASAKKLFVYENQLPFNGGKLKILDCRWSSDGFTLAATDEYGHLIVFSMDGHPRRFEHLPREIFFHTDYWPLTTDACTGTLLDENTLKAPHLMLPPLLVNKAKEKYPANLQRLVPGRENLPESELLEICSEERRHAHMEEEEREFEKQKCTIFDFSSKPVHLNRNMINSPTRQTQFDPSNRKLANNSERWLDESDLITTNVALPLHATSTTVRGGRGETRYSFRHQKQSDFKKFFGEQISEPPSEPEFNPDSISESSDSDLDSDSSLDKGILLGAAESPLRNDVTATRSVRKKLVKSKRPRRRVPENDCYELQVDIRSKLASKSKNAVMNTAMNKRHKADIPSCVSENSAVYDWHLSDTKLKGGFVPQLGDTLIFISQKYQRYVEHIRTTRLYKMSPRYFLTQSWNVNAEDEVPVRVNNLKFQNYPAVVMVIELQLLDLEGNEMSNVINVCYSYVPEISDYLVPRHVYDKSLQSNWNIGDRFRCLRNENWMFGAIESIEIFSPEFPLSKFNSLKTILTSGVQMILSPWDVEKVPDGITIPETDILVVATEEEISSRLYEVNALDWPPYGYQESECDRISQRLTEVMLLGAAEFFVAPVDLSLYPDYRIKIHYPVDLLLIRARLNNRFYRRVESLLFDTQNLALNAETFFSPRSDVVKKSRIIYDLIKLIVQNKITDIGAAYRELEKNFVWGSAVRNKDLKQKTEKNVTKKTGKAANAVAPPNVARNHLPTKNLGMHWIEACQEILVEMWNDPSGQPFQQPVDSVEEPDYYMSVSSPMDLQSIREDLKGGNYRDPLKFSKDVQQIFTNSAQFNKERKPDIYRMGLKLKEIFDSKIECIIKQWRRLNQTEESTAIKPRKVPVRELARNVKKFSNVSSKPVHPNTDVFVRSVKIVNDTVMSSVKPASLITRRGLKRKQT